MKKIYKKNDPLDFAILALLLLAGLGGYFVFNHRPAWQMLSVGITSGGYVMWGIWHHRGHLALTIIVEYILISLLAIALVISNLFLVS